jgi:hypothetical protein
MYFLLSALYLELKVVNVGHELSNFTLLNICRLMLHNQQSIDKFYNNCITGTSYKNRDHHFVPVVSQNKDNKFFIGK